MRGLQLLDLVRGDEPLPRELPDGLKEAVAGARTVVVDEQQGLVDQPTEAVQHVRGGNPLVRAHLLGRREREAAGEDREPPQQDLLVVRQQGVAPLERGSQRRMPSDLAVPTEQGERLAQPLGDLRRLEVRHAGGGELQGERDAVETAADLHDRRGVVRVEDESGPDVLGPVDEESYRGQSPEPAQVAGILRLGELE